jgi:hypothetical protein
LLDQQNENVEVYSLHPGIIPSSDLFKYVNTCIKAISMLFKFICKVRH